MKKRRSLKPLDKEESSKLIEEVLEYAKTLSKEELSKFLQKFREICNKVKPICEWHLYTILTITINYF